MPQAVDSNSTPAARIHPAAALIKQSLDNLSGIFQAYRVFAESLPDTGDAKNPFLSFINELTAELTFEVRKANTIT